jgi:hypothetical protein
MAFKLTKNNSFETSSLYEYACEEKEIAGKKERIFRSFQRILGEIYTHVKDYRSSSEFDCINSPTMELKDYAKRINTFLNCSAESYVVSLIYIDRLCSSNTELSRKNIHKYLINIFQK